MRTCVYPGSFDPITSGHLDIISRIVDMFDRVLVTVLNNSSKQSFFTVEEKLDFLRKTTADFENVTVGYHDGLLVDFAKANNAPFIVRGLRAISDFELELQMASLNKKLYPDVETVFLMTNTDFSFVSSKMVKEIGTLGGNLQTLVPDVILDDVKRRLRVI